MDRTIHEIDKKLRSTLLQQNKVNSVRPPQAAAKWMDAIKCDPAKTVGVKALCSTYGISSPKASYKSWAV